jgi:hypothetical protein
VRLISIARRGVGGEVNFNSKERGRGVRLISIARRGVGSEVNFNSEEKY